MIEAKGSLVNDLFRYKDGKIKQGLGIGCELDTYLRFKPRQVNIILGHDNVGKTFWVTWYQLTLSMVHGIKWCIWSGENQSWKIMRDMIQMLSGRPFKDLTHDEIMRYNSKIEQYFEFVDNSDLYSPEALLSLFENTDCDACIIDPFTGLDRSMEWKENYTFLNQARHFANRTNKTLYINTHPISSAGRQNNTYPEKHAWAGHIKSPLKDDIEGGKAFLNRCDDMIVLHRLVKHEKMKYYTMLSVEKIKDMETGGRHTNFDSPLLFEWNYGLGFKVVGIDPLKSYRQIKIQDKLWS